MRLKSAEKRQKFSRRKKSRNPLKATAEKNFQKKLRLKAEAVSRTFQSEKTKK